MTNEQTEKPAAPFYKRISEIIRDPAMWQDVPRVEPEDVIGIEIVIHDAIILTGEIGGKATEYAVVLFAGPADAPEAEQMPTGVMVPENARTTLLGGGVVARKLRMLSGQMEGHRNQLPVMMTLVQRRNRANTSTYWDVQ